ncbi:hypothetical protein QBC39DRAFT_336480 [Podospora conica]|nr:hypothetical protein QBC39DRAFT_336480 [Schizothecium conicum]
MSLFVASRSALRAAAPLKRTVQTSRYSTAPSGSGSSNSTLAILLGTGLATGAGAYYYFQRPAAATEVLHKAKETAAAAGVPGAATKKALTGGDQGFVSLELQGVETVNHNTKILRFALPEEDMVSGVTFTSAVLTKFKPDTPDAKPVIRPYTPISEEDARGHVDLLVKKYPNGPMSSHLHDLRPGDKLEIKGPLPKYPWTANKHDHVALVAGGTGITPMWQLCRAIFNNPEDKTKVTLVFGNVSEKDILLKEELDKLENTYPQRFRAFYVLDNPPKSWVGGSGFITKELLKTVLPEAKEENVKVFVCGPPGMMNAVSGNKKSPRDQGELVGILKELGYTSEQVYKF